MSAEGFAGKDGSGMRAKQRSAHIDATVVCKTCAENTARRLLVNR